MSIVICHENKTWAPNKSRSSGKITVNVSFFFLQFPYFILVLKSENQHDSLTRKTREAIPEADGLKSVILKVNNIVIHSTIIKYLWILEIFGFHPSPWSMRLPLLLPPEVHPPEPFLVNVRMVMQLKVGFMYLMAYKRKCQPRHHKK